MNRAGSAGFTLIEVLVAFVIGALALGVLLEIFGTGFRTLSAAADRIALAQTLQSRLALLSGGGLFEGSVVDEAAPGITERVQVRPLALPGEDASRELPLPPLLVGVTLEKEDGGASDITVWTVRLRRR